MVRLAVVQNVPTRRTSHYVLRLRLSSLQVWLWTTQNTTSIGKIKGELL